MPLDSGLKVSKGKGGGKQAVATDIKKTEILWENHCGAIGLRIKGK